MSRRQKLGEFGRQLVALFSMVTGDSNAQHMMSGQECVDRTQGRSSLSCASPALVSVAIRSKSSLKGLKPDPLRAAYENAYESYVALEALKTMSHLASMA